MKICIDRATTIQLNWLVARHEGKDQAVITPYCTDAAFADRIINREGISMRSHAPYPEWGASKKPSDGDVPLTTGGNLFAAYGPTKFIAAMRCFLVSKYGREVDAPDGLDQASVDESKPDLNVPPQPEAAPTFTREDGCSGGSYRCSGCGSGWTDHEAPGCMCPSPIVTSQIEGNTDVLNPTERERG